MEQKQGKEKVTRQDAAAVWHCWNQMEVYLQQMFTVIEEAEGVEMTDQDGKVYLDANSSLWNVNIGHRNQKVIQAITEQLQQLDHASLFLSTNSPAVRLAKKLKELTGGRYGHVFYTNSGSEATDTAIKIARQYFYNRGETGRYKVISLDRGYHGSTLGAISACGIAYDKRAFGPLMPGFFQVAVPDPFDAPEGMTPEAWAEVCLQELNLLIEQEGPETVCAFIAEPVQGSEGVCVIPDSYWRGVRELCDRTGILWISDEIATGFGRTGRMFAAEHSGVWPDLMLLAKGITSGYMPLGAVLVPGAVFDGFLGSVKSEREFVHGFTTSGHPVACAAALANIEVIEEEELAANSEAAGAYLLEGMLALKEQFPSIVDVQGKGLLLGIRLAEWTGKSPMTAEWPPAMLAMNFLAKRGLITHAAGSHAVVLAPSLTFTTEHCDRVLLAFTQVLTTLEKIWGREKYVST